MMPVWLELAVKATGLVMAIVRLGVLGLVALSWLVGLVVHLDDYAVRKRMEAHDLQEAVRRSKP